MPEHCERKYVVYTLEPSSGGADYPARVIEAPCCPFCGQRLEPISPAPKPQSKRGRDE